jgi:hypothetical protein
LRFGLLLQMKRFADLEVLSDYELVVCIACTVVPGKYLQCFVASIFIDKPPGRLREEEDKNNLEDCWCGLQNGRETPSPRVGDAEGS